MTGVGVLIIAISAVTGATFAALAGLSISEIAFPVRRFHLSSVFAAAIAICLAYLAFRASLAGNTNEEIAVASLRRGVLGAVVCLIVMAAFLILFRIDLQAFLAHTFGKPASSFTTYRLVAASVLLGFGAGFVVGMPKKRD